LVKTAEIALRRPDAADSPVQTSVLVWRATAKGWDNVLLNVVSPATDLPANAEGCVDRSWRTQRKTGPKAEARTDDEK
jgi:hypothetical protein